MNIAIEDRQAEALIDLLDVDGGGTISYFDFAQHIEKNDKYVWKNEIHSIDLMES